LQNLFQGNWLSKLARKSNSMNIWKKCQRLEVDIVVT
jgi:hypothetical protein